MILLNALVGLFAIFVSPQIVLFCRASNLHYALRILIGFCISLTAIWILFLFSYFLSLPNSVIKTLSYSVVLLTFVLLLQKKCKNYQTIHYFFVWILSFVILLPLFTQLGTGFSALDAAASWNRWAIELYNNIYKPIDAAYPILLPALWSMIYKIQASNDIWWTAQITLFLLPLFVTVILLELFKESKNSAYLLMLLFVYPYFLSSPTINGNMDMPVMYMGLLSLISLYAAEQYEGEKEYSYYTYTALLLAGLASIVKQAGISYLVFVILYIVLNYRKYKERKILLGIIGFSLLYFASFLVLYYQQSYSSVTGNINHLEHLSNKFGAWNAFISRPMVMYHRFYMQPEDIPIFTPLLSAMGTITPSSFFIVFSLVLFLPFRALRRYRSVSFLSMVFFLLGVLVWVKYFSYDFRNSLWIRAYFIMFVAINIAYLLQKLRIQGITLLKTLFLLLLTLLTFVTAKVGDDYALRVQKKSQISVCQKPQLAKYAAELLEHKKSCCKVYTNELALPYNYYVKKYQKRGQFIPIGRDYKFQDFSYLENNCSDGSYMIIRSTTMYMDEWWKIQKLLDNKLIVEIKPLIYYIPPGLKIDKSLFTLEGKIATVAIPADQTHDIKFSIDSFLREKTSLYLKGWAFVPDQNSKLSQKYIVLKNSQHTYVVTTVDHNRNDVAKFFNNPLYEYSGFQVQMDLTNFAKGKYALMMLIVDKDNKRHLVNTHRDIEI